MMPWLYSALGLVILLLAGDALVRGAVNLSLRLGVPALIVSLTIVAFGTSAPELLRSDLTFHSTSTSWQQSQSISDRRWSSLDLKQRYSNLRKGLMLRANGFQRCRGRGWNCPKDLQIPRNQNQCCRQRKQDWRLKNSIVKILILWVIKLFETIGRNKIRP